MKNRAGARVCGKCGATIPPNAPQQSCGACLLETGLNLLGEDGQAEVGAILTPILMLKDFGDYELIEQIGRGGQGVVFRARQKGLNRTVALKIIALGHWATPAHIKRFHREAEAAASLDHPRIVPIYEIGERDGSCYFSMKYIEGESLDERIKIESFPVRCAAELIVKLSHTVAYAHDRGVLHRDIKPANILLDGNGEPNLTDFGLARLVQTESDVTRTLEVLGTPSYIAPEQAREQKGNLTTATDVYGLGAVFYHLLTSHPPFLGNSTYETIKLVCETDPRAPEVWNPKVDHDLSTICLKCLEKDPARRYSSALALGQDVERWLRHEPIRARRASVMTRARKWVRRHPVIAAITPLAIALAVASGLLLRQKELPASSTGIAVLPFDDLSDNKDATFADGIQDDILTKLAKISGLKVISRTSVMQYRGAKDIRKIGHALGVSHILEGSVRKQQDRMHLNAQLIDTRTDAHVWAEEYDRDLTDLFAVQSNIAQKVVGELKTKISAAERMAIQIRPTQDLETYDLYLRAKALNSASIPDETSLYDRLPQAVELLEKAIARDPNFYLGYCLLTETNLNLYWMMGRADLSRRARAEAALREAQRLAPDAGETHLATALFYHYGDRDYDHALEQLDIAARLLPNSPDVFSLSARMERRLGRWSEALRHFSRASELDPRDHTRLAAVAETYRLLRHYNEAEQIAERGLGSFPETPDDFWNMKGQCALDQGDLQRARGALEKISAPRAFPALQFAILLYERDYAQAERWSARQFQHNDDAEMRYFGFWLAQIARAQRAAEKLQSSMLAVRRAYEPLLTKQPVDPNALSYVGMIDAALGRKEDALRESRTAVELRPISQDALEGAENATALAVVYAWTGERDRAIEQLSYVVRFAHAPTAGELKLDPTWDEVRNDPRFTAIVAEAAKPVPLR